MVHPHLCKDCFEVNKGYQFINNGQKRCKECGGVVLDMQETADLIAELASELRALREIYGE